MSKTYARSTHRLRETISGSLVLEPGALASMLSFWVEGLPDPGLTTADSRVGLAAMKSSMVPAPWRSGSVANFEASAGGNEAESSDWRSPPPVLCHCITASQSKGVSMKGLKEFMMKTSKNDGGKRWAGWSTYKRHGDGSTDRGLITDLILFTRHPQKHSQFCNAC